MKKIINYGHHTIFEEDVKNVSKVLKSSFLTQGPFVQKFEHALAKKFKTKFCTVVSNGSSALYLIGKALKWKKGDTVLTTPISFLATSNCIELNKSRGFLFQKKIYFKILNIFHIIKKFLNYVCLNDY